MKIPYLSVVLTDKCNLKCIYCPPNGEAYGSKKQKFDFKSLEKRLDIIKNTGIKKIRLTGGEPLLVPNIRHILSTLSDYDFEISLDTNGTLLDKFFEDLARIPKLSLKVSMDTLESRIFKELSGIDKFGKVYENILEASRRKLLTRINTVITTQNYMEIPKLLNFTQEIQTDIKILDLYPIPCKMDLWKELFFPVSIVEKQLIAPNNKGKKELLYTQRFGIPVTEYEFGNINVRIKDATKGTRYVDFCKDCTNFPCTEGIYTIYLTPDNHLKPCYFADSKLRLNLKYQNFEQSLNSMIKLFNKSKLSKAFWQLSKYKDVYNQKERQYEGTFKSRK